MIFRCVQIAQDYYPFGSTMPGRMFTSKNYRFGFQGEEEDDESGFVYFKYRLHDPRLGRFFATDPLEASFPWNSPYAFSENRLIDGIELEGLEVLLIQLEGRVSSPLPLLGLVGLTGSKAFGVGITLWGEDAGKGMVYETVSAGVQFGVFIGGGLELGYFNGSLEDMKNKDGINFGGAIAMSPILVGPEGGFEGNATIPKNENGEVDFFSSDWEGGATISGGPTGYAAGFTIYADYSKTNSIMDFTISELRDVLKDFYYNNMPFDENTTQKERESDFQNFVDTVFDQIRQAKENLKRTIEGDDSGK